MLKPKKGLKIVDPITFYFKDMEALKQRHVQEREGPPSDPNPEPRSETKQKCIEKHLALVVSVAKKYKDQMPLLDLIQEGNLDLMKAVDHFDAKRGFQFSTYASQIIRRAIQEAIRIQKPCIELPKPRVALLKKIEKTRQGLEQKGPIRLLELAKSLQISIDQLQTLLSSPDAAISIDRLPDQHEAFIDGRLPSPLQELITEERDRLLASAFKGLKGRERKMIRMRFGMSGEEEHTLEAIGNHYDLSRERIRQIEKTALTIMRKALCKAGYVP